MTKIVGALLLIATVGVVSCQAFFEEPATDREPSQPTAPHLQRGGAQ